MKTMFAYLLFALLASYRSAGAAGQPPAQQTAEPQFLKPAEDL